VNGSRLRLDANLGADPVPAASPDGGRVLFEHCAAPGTNAAELPAWSVRWTLSAEGRTA